MSPNARLVQLVDNLDERLCVLVDLGIERGVSAEAATGTAILNLLLTAHLEPSWLQGIADISRAAFDGKDPIDRRTAWETIRAVPTHPELPK